MLRVAAAIAFVLVAWLVPPGFTAEVAEVGDGRPQFTIFPQILKARSPREPFEVLVGFHAKYVAKDQIATGYLELGKGLELVSGRLTHSAHVSNSWTGPKDNLWRVTLRATDLGQFDVRASVVAEVGPDRRDESASLLTIKVEETGVSGLARPLRKETIRNGQRFRYDRFLVPIDGPEEVTAAEIIEPARATHEEIARCNACGKEGRRIPFVVFLDSVGRIRSHRALSSDPAFNQASHEAILAAEEALARWRFSPSRTQKQAIAGWAIARVTVEGQD